MNIQKTDQNICCICLETIEQNINISQLKCQHCIHSTCLKQYIKWNYTECPICRKSFETKPNHVTLRRSIAPTFIFVFIFLIIFMESYKSFQIANEICRIIFQIIVFSIFGGLIYVMLFCFAYISSSASAKASCFWIGGWMSLWLICATLKSIPIEF